MIVLSLVSFSASGQECRNSSAELASKASLAILQTASGSSVVHLENSQSVDLPVNLTAGPFVSHTTGAVVSGVVSFTAGSHRGVFVGIRSRHDQERIYAIKWPADSFDHEMRDKEGSVMNRIPNGEPL
jgi:hypothetical protein